MKGPRRNCRTDVLLEKIYCSANKRKLKNCIQRDLKEYDIHEEYAVYTNKTKQRKSTWKLRGKNAEI